MVNNLEIIQIKLYKISSLYLIDSWIFMTTP